MLWPRGSPTKISQSSEVRGSTNTWWTDEVWWHDLRKPWGKQHHQSVNTNTSATWGATDSRHMLSRKQTAHCDAVPARHLSGPAFLLGVDTASLDGCPGWTMFCWESSWEKLKTHGPRTTPKPGSLNRGRKFYCCTFCNVLLNITSWTFTHLNQKIPTLFAVTLILNLVISQSFDQQSVTYMTTVLFILMAWQLCRVFCYIINAKFCHHQVRLQRHYNKTDKPEWKHSATITAIQLALLTRQTVYHIVWYIWGCFN